MKLGKGSVRKMTPIKSPVLDGLGKMRMPAPNKPEAFVDCAPDGEEGGHGATQTCNNTWNRVGQIHLHPIAHVASLHGTS